MPTPTWSQTWREIASPELGAALETLAVRRRFSDGELIYQRGDPGRELYGVRRGAVRLLIVGDNGLEGVIGLYGPGTWFGEVSLFDEMPRPSSAVASGDSEIDVVPAARLRAVLDTNPLWYRDFARVLCNKLRLSLVHIESTFLAPSVRVVLRLLDLARVYGKPGDTGVTIDLQLPQEELGRMLGITRQSVNKELKALEQCGWISVGRGRITLVDAAALVRHVRDRGGGGLLEG